MKKITGCTESNKWNLPSEDVVESHLLKLKPKLGLKVLNTASV